MKITESNIEQFALETARLEQAIEDAKASAKKRIDRIKKEFAHVDDLEEQLANRLLALRLWADEHMDRDSDSKGRHMDLGSVRIGFKLAPWSVQMINPSKVGELEAARMLREIGYKELIVDEPKLDKRAILSTRTDLDTRSDLNRAGLTFRQMEDFYVVEVER